jgi:hypothetical protein
MGSTHLRARAYVCVASHLRHLLSLSLSVFLSLSLSLSVSISLSLSLSLPMRLHSPTVRHVVERNSHLRPLLSLSLVSLCLPACLSVSLSLSLSLRLLSLTHRPSRCGMRLRAPCRSVWEGCGDAGHWLQRKRGAVGGHGAVLPQPGGIPPTAVRIN